MMDAAADDFAAIAKRLREIEAERDAAQEPNADNLIVSATEKWADDPALLTLTWTWLDALAATPWPRGRQARRGR